MRVFKRVGITLALVLFLSIVMTGFQVYFDMVKREEDLNSFVRLAIKDAIVNIQTTEESGLNFQSAMGRKYAESGYKAYLSSLSAQANHLDTLNLIQQFLADNADESGDSRFRPIQFGMTYVDKSLFVESFTASLQKLVDSNYNRTVSKDSAGNNSVFGTKAEGTLVVKSTESLTDGFVPNGALSDRTAFSSNVAGYDIFINISDPHLVEIDNTSDVTQEKIFESLYGDDLRKEYLDMKASAGANLGISSDSMPNFFIYYDITVVVGWASVTTNPLLGRGFLGNVWQVPDSYFSKTNNYLMIPGRPIEYTYRYVLLN